MCESLSQPYNCWECPELDTCEVAKEIVEKIIPYELRRLGCKLDLYVQLRKVDVKLDFLLKLRKTEKRLDHLLQLKKVGEKLDRMLSKSKNYVEKINNIFNRLKKEFKAFK
ncbi:MAG TPA: hypothetical protein VGB37_00890 [Candidatus Lokiarchaeia archaeon]